MNAIDANKPSNGWLQAGDTAPDFELRDQSGAWIRLDSFRGRWVVLFFYPRDGSFGCTAEACEFRDQYSEFKSAGAEVLGISSDSVESHQKFASEHKLPYRILADSGESIRKLYGVPKTLGVIRSRVTFVMDPQGKIRNRFSSQFSFQTHATQAFDVIEMIRKN